jgi:hypothetical protein
MGDNEYKVLTDAIEKAESDIILLVVILAAVLLVLTLPLYGLILKDRKHQREVEVKRRESETAASNDRQDKYMEREQRIIEVVTSNTQVMASLRTTLERDGKLTSASLDRIHKRIDDHYELAHRHGTGITKVDKALDELVIISRKIKDEITRLHK